MRQGEPQGTQSLSDQRSQATVAQRAKRSTPGKKHFPPNRAGAYLPQVAQHSVAYFAAQRVSPRLLTFTVGDGQDLSLPVEVLETQTGDFARTEPVHRHEHQECPSSDVGGPISLHR